MVLIFANSEKSLEYLHDHPVYAIALRDAGGQTEDLLEVVPPPEVIRPGELPLRLPESEVRLLLDPVLNPGLVPGDGLELELQSLINRSSGKRALRPRRPRPAPPPIT